MTVRRHQQGTMGAMQSLELLLDDDTDATVRAEWSVLRDAGLPSQADHTGASNAPHVTLLVTEQLPTTDDELGAELGPMLPLRVRLGPVVAFPGRRIELARLVLVDEPLLQMHAAALGRSGASATPLTANGRWVPHVTLARGIPEEEAAKALALRWPPDLEGTVTQVRRWDSTARQTFAVADAGTPS